MKHECMHVKRRVIEVCPTIVSTFIETRRLMYNTILVFHSLNVQESFDFFLFSPRQSAITVYTNGKILSAAQIVT